MEMNSLKNVNVQLQTQLHAQDSLGQDDADGASSLTSQVMLIPKYMYVTTLSLLLLACTKFSEISELPTFR